MRLNKYIASTGRCSRRAADELIEAGRVRLNGRPAKAGDRVLPGDAVTVDGRAVQIEEGQVCLMLHKPVQVVSTASDPQGRRTVLDFVPEAYRHLRLYPVGRLDYFSEGLILLTNDGALAQRLTHPSHRQTKVYQVLVRGQVTAAVLRTLRGGMTLAEGDRTAPCEVMAAGAPNGETLLTITLHQGLNRQIRRMCRDTGLTVLRLKRVAEGGLGLGSLAPGQVRELAPEEVRALRED
ncbi:MAG: pseudouridine synthase [Desulfovibrionaceae bacterium]|nr:pseudouridine synthase [Desulfovibrionaceae bacterium]